MKQGAKISQHQINKAFEVWRSNYKGLRESDLYIQPFLEIKNHKISWLKMCRVAMQLSVVQVAKKLDVSRQAYCRMEGAELGGRISLASLEAAAQALECELVYGLRPKNKKLFSKIHWQRALPEALKYPPIQNYSQPGRLAFAIAGEVKRQLHMSKTRLRNGLSFRKPKYIRPELA